MMQQFGLESSEDEQLPALEDLQPLYQAVTHGCLAGRHEEACANVYRDRILRGTRSGGFYSTKKLGAIGADLGAVAAFFDRPWSQLSPNLRGPDQAWLLNAAALRLRALGRLDEAVEPMREAVDWAEHNEKWVESAIGASNLSELELTLGQVQTAVDDGRRAVEFADQTDDQFRQMVTRITAADALHQAGETAGAHTLFADAEQRQAARQPQFKLLYSLQGFRYVDLLLGPAEWAAWQTHLTTTVETEAVRPRTSLDIYATFTGPGAGAARLADPLTACDEVERRAKQAFEVAKQYNLSLLDIGLDQLTLARGALYRALLTGVSSKSLPKRVTEALSAFRQANRSDYLPKAILTAALWAGTVGEQPEEARRYLDEAQLIAERGPMPLYLADIHLHRARLFRDKNELAKAETLIKKHGYGRRHEELTDAKAAAAEW